MTSKKETDIILQSDLLSFVRAEAQRKINKEVGAERGKLRRENAQLKKKVKELEEFKKNSLKGITKEQVEFKKKFKAKEKDLKKREVELRRAQIRVKQEIGALDKIKTLTMDRFISNYRNRSSWDTEPMNSIAVRDLKKRKIE